MISVDQLTVTRQHLERLQAVLHRLTECRHFTRLGRCCLRATPKLLLHVLPTLVKDRESKQQSSEGESESEASAAARPSEVWYTVCCTIIRESSQSCSGHDALFCEGSCQRWYHRWCVNVSQEDYKLLADSSDPFICPACTAKKQSTIIQQLQSAIQSLNTEVQDLKAMVTALQSSSCGSLQGAAIGDTETGGGESRAKEAPPACEESELPWNRKRENE